MNETKQLSSIYTYGTEPGTNEIEDLAIEVNCKDTSIVMDRLILVIVPDSTVQEHNTWYSQWSTDTAWWAELPAAYATLGSGNSDPEPPPPICTPVEQFWENDIISLANNFYHPGAAVQIRSEEVDLPGINPGHQVTYSAIGVLITSGVAAGSADRSHYTNAIPFGTSHRILDVLPFVRAAQLDGNPVDVNDLAPLNFNRPMMHEGTHLQQYLQVRPPIPNAKPLLAPGTCGP